MRRAKVFILGRQAGVLEEIVPGECYAFEYLSDYVDEPLSLALPTTTRRYEFKSFPPFFDGVLPEGSQLEALLRHGKIDKRDLFSQLIAVGKDLVGAVTVEE